MLNVFYIERCRARARPLALAGCAWIVLMPTALAAETAPPEPVVPAPFQQYQGWRDEPLQNWREANERVGAIGGWRTYLREAQQGNEGTDNGHDHHGH